jgi:hypothetical protein
MDDNAANPANLPSDPAAQRIVFVAGSGRSGTSLMAGILQQLGYHVPQPEVPADASNPKGFSEPAWVVDFHNRLLRAARVHPSDARPSAWFETGKALNRLHPRTDLADWLEEQLAVGQDLVIKDPRLIWFLPMWQQCADRLRARSSVVTMLRHPAEVVASKEKTYGGLLNTTNRTAGWLNLMLYTERSTRDTPRAFIQYADLLEDWTSTVAGLGDALEQPVIQQATAARIRDAHRFIDPDLRRSLPDWGPLGVPERLRSLADEAWQALLAIAVDPVDHAAQSSLDDLRRRYVDLYDEAEAVAFSSVKAAAEFGDRAKPDRARAASTPTAEQPDQTHRRQADQSSRSILHTVQRRRARLQVPTGPRRSTDDEES